MALRARYRPAGLLLVVLVLIPLLTTTAEAVYDSATPAPAGDVQVLRVTPEGDEVPAGRQIVVTFDRAMVPIGDMSVDAEKSPVALEPRVNCHWHWLDPRSLACELDAGDALAPATQYQVIVRAGIKSDDGAELHKPHIARFTTIRPRLTSYSFMKWRAPGTPAILVVFNQPVSQPSVEKFIRFSGKAATSAEPPPFPTPVFWVLPMPGEKLALVVPPGAMASRSNQKAIALLDENGRKVEARQSWVVAPADDYPADSHALLRVLPGLRSFGGPLPGTEDRTVVEFDAFPEFRFLGIRCRAPASFEVLAAQTPLDKQPRCDPLARVSLVFSAPVIAQELKHHLKVSPELAGERTDYDPWDNVFPGSSLEQPHARGQQYEVALPEHLKAYHDYALAGLEAIKDEFGRAQAARATMAFRTDHRPPRLRLGTPVAVLEQQVPSALPLYVTNLTDLEFRYSRFTIDGFDQDLDAKQPVTPVWDVAYAVPAMVRELLGGRSGVIEGSVAPHPTPPTVDTGQYFDDDAPPLSPNGAGAGRQGERDITVVVTPFQVHVKLGHFNSLAWVTRLADGLPVAGAQVAIYQDDAGNPARPARAWGPGSHVLAQALTDSQGIARLPGRDALPAAREPFFGAMETPLSVLVRSGQDLAWLPLDSNFYIDSYRASRGTIAFSPFDAAMHARAWGTTAQGVYRLGDTVQFKVFLRDQDNLTLTMPEVRDGYQLVVQDPTGKPVYEKKELRLSDFGAFADEFRVPANGAVGWYQFLLSHPGVDAPATGAPATGAADRRHGRVRGARAGERSWAPLRVLVADFTPAPFQVQTTLNASLYQPGDDMDIATSATLHAGGPYANAPARVTARMRVAGIDTDAPEAADFWFDNAQHAHCTGERLPWDWIPIDQAEATVDERGELKTRFTLGDAGIMSGRIEVESAVRDERGKYVAARAPADYRGRDRFVGLRSSKWTFEEGKPAAVQYLVIDEHGKLVADVPVDIAILGQVVTAARVKGAGNAYLTSYDFNWEDRGACSGKSETKPRTCTFTPGRPGLYSIEASVRDTRGRTHASEMCVWVTGKGRVLWQEPDDMSLSLVPEKKSYAVGEHLRVLVRNPFPGARALVTIERYGVIKSWVQTLEGNTPVLDVPVERDFLPGFYLSVLAMSPRVAPVPGAAPLAADGVDLGRPTYRLGYAQIDVADPYKALDVSIRSDRPAYKPRERVRLQLHAQAKHGPANEPVEFAVVALDEAVFDLIPDGKSYFDPYRGFYQLDALDLMNFGLLARLVGLQKFEKKGASAGGDGGPGFDLRSISKYVAYWNPAVRADAAGNAAVDFTLPDNLTGWRVFAIATTPRDHLGLGDYKFKSSKPTELRPVMPNQLTQGDRVQAGFSVLNRADHERDIAVRISASGPIEGGTRVLEKKIRLGPFKRETLFLPLLTTDAGTVALQARAGDAMDGDALAHTIPVHRRVSLDVGASYGTTQSAGVTETVQFPANMMPGVGDLSVTLAPSVIGNIDGAFRYVRDYPYGCWEQRLARALMAANFRRLHEYLPADLTWDDAQALPQTVLDEAADFQAPDGGMAFFAPQDDRVSPYLSAATALAFGELRGAGYRVPEEVERKLLDYLGRVLRTQAVPTFYSEGMASSVRAVALQALAQRGRLALADLDRYRDEAPRMDLFGLAAYLQAALQVKGGEALAESLAKRILAHSDASGGKLQFTETWNDGYAQLLATPLRSQCAILQAFLGYGATEAGDRLLGDVPFKLVRSVTSARGARTHWENTQENLYCANALSAYAALYEKTAPALSARVRLDEQPVGSARFDSLAAPPVALARANGAGDAGRKAALHIERAGEGRLYYATRLSYAPTDATASEVNRGIEVHREYSVQRQGAWTLLASPMRVQRGELVRVDLYVSLPGARNFVVVDDPVPGGLEPVNRDLATASTVDADEARFAAAGGSFWFRYGDWSEYGLAFWSFYHQELKNDAARFFADYLPAGHYHLSYAAQAMAAGTFAVAPARTEEMYEPDVYGMGLPAQLVVDDE